MMLEVILKVGVEGKIKQSDIFIIILQDISIDINIDINRLQALQLIENMQYLQDFDWKAMLEIAPD